MTSKFRIILILLIVIVVGIVGYTIGKNSSKSVSSNSVTLQTTTNSEDTTSLLNNKAKCASYLNQAQSDAESESSGSNLYVVDSIVYSPKLTTCLTEGFILSGGQGNDPGQETLYINDYLTNRTLWSSQIYSPSLKAWDAEAKLDQAATAYLN